MGGAQAIAALAYGTEMIPRVDKIFGPGNAWVTEAKGQVARDPNGVSDELYTKLTGYFKPDQLVALTAFGCVMIATNVFNNALRVDLDEYLWPFREAKKGEA